MAVLDILPNCVSSVYFMYDQVWGRFSLGKVSRTVLDGNDSIDQHNMKLSALREVSLAREIREAGAVEMSSLYMGQSFAHPFLALTLIRLLLGFYIYSCPKMRYKGEYSPSYLADPVTIFIMFKHK